MSRNGSEENKVGYKKPPLGTRFKKGKSGNPGGRPKGIKSMAAFAHDVLSQEVQIRVDGKLKRFSIEELASRSLGKKAAEGDFPLIKTLMEWREALIPVDEPGPIIFTLHLEEDDRPQHPTGYPVDPPPGE